MNEVIISPMWIYLIGSIDRLFSLLAIVSMVSGFVVLVSTFLEGCNISEIPKPIIYIFIISSLLLVFIPSRNTIIQMMVAKHITYETLNDAKHLVEKVYLDILTVVGK